MTTPAIRNTNNGRVHLDSGRRSRYLGSAAVVGACGRDVEKWEPATWEDSAPADRCGMCARRAPIEGAGQQGPIEEEA